VVKGRVARKHPAVPEELELVYRLEERIPLDVGAPSRQVERWAVCVLLDRPRSGDVRAEIGYAHVLVFTDGGVISPPAIRPRSRPPPANRRIERVPSRRWAVCGRRSVSVIGVTVCGCSTSVRRTCKQPWRNWSRRDRGSTLIHPVSPNHEFGLDLILDGSSLRP
jgi:hypothetical protein